MLVLLILISIIVENRNLKEIFLSHLNFIIYYIILTSRKQYCCSWSNFERFVYKFPLWYLLRFWILIFLGATFLYGNTKHKVVQNLNLQPVCCRHWVFLYCYLYSNISNLFNKIVIFFINLDLQKELFTPDKVNLYHKVSFTFQGVT